MPPNQPIKYVQQLKQSIMKNLKFSYVSSAKYAKVAGEIYECRILGVYVNAKDASVRYKVELPYGTPYIPSDEISFYEDKESAVSGTQKDGIPWSFRDVLRMVTDVYPDTYMDEEDGECLCYKTFLDGEYIPDYKPCDEGHFVLEINEEDDYKWSYDVSLPKGYYTQNEALAYNSIEVKNLDGTTDYVGGTLKGLLFTDEQKKAKDNLLNAIEDAKDAGISFFFRDGRIGIFNSENIKEVNECNVGDGQIDEYGFVGFIEDESMIIEDGLYYDFGYDCGYGIKFKEQK